MSNHCLQRRFVYSNILCYTFPQFLWKIQWKKITRNKRLTSLSLCFCLIVHDTNRKSSCHGERVIVFCGDFHDFPFRANIVFIMFKTCNHVCLPQNSFSWCDWNWSVKHSNICGQFGFQIVFICKHIFSKLNYKLWMSSSSVKIKLVKFTISVSASPILHDCDVISSCTSFNVHAVITRETTEFASKLCATCEIVFGDAVSSQTQLSTARSIVIVFHDLAVAFTISRTVVSPFNCCSIVNKYGKLDGNIQPSFTIMFVELDEIALTKNETMLFAVLYQT